MKLSHKSHLKIESFFRDYLQDEKFILPKIEFYGGRFTHFLTSILKIEGITIGKRIFIFPNHFWRSRTSKLRLGESLAVHEITHVLQYRRDGIFKFLFKYFQNYWRNLRKLKKWDKFAMQMAYFEIEYEREAREAERKYSIWKEKKELSKIQ